jgi:hypothetical protein
MSGAHPVLNLMLDGDGAFKDLVGREHQVIHHGTALTMAVLPHGMASGKPSLMLRINLEDGRVVLVEQSMSTMATALHAVAQRYPTEAAPRVDYHEQRTLMMAVKLATLEVIYGRPQLDPRENHLGSHEQWNAVLDQLLSSVVGFDRTHIGAIVTEMARTVVREPLKHPMPLVGALEIATFDYRAMTERAQRGELGRGAVCLISFFKRRVFAALSAETELIVDSVNALRVVPPKSGGCPCGGPWYVLGEG